LKHLVFIAALVAAPVHAASFDDCTKLANFVESTANARDAGMSMQAAQALVSEAVPNADMSRTMQDTVRLIYNQGASASPAQLAMAMFNACMEN
jgi:hypothetical protein